MARTPLARRNSIKPESRTIGIMIDHQVDREAARHRFLSAAGWSSAAANPLAGDASTRAYERLELKGRRAILMNAPPGAEEAACPPKADTDERKRLGYNAVARLAGPNLNAFVALAVTLHGAGLSAPEIYFSDAVNGFALMEDLGDDLFVRAVDAGSNEDTLYAAAIDTLLALRKAAPPAPKTSTYQMLDYDHPALEIETKLLIDWYWKLRRGEPASPTLQTDYSSAWAPALMALSAPHIIVLRDYHAENLLWMPEREGVARVGLIDFQDALFGCAAYDLVSLLEDARRDVSPNLAEAMLNRYCHGAARQGSFDEDQFRHEYAILGAQRNAKILGIFARLSERDGKRRYLDFIPRVEAHFRNNLHDPALRTVRDFFSKHLPELAL